MPTPRFCGERFVASSPRISTRPSSDCSRPAITRSSVDLPLPLGPSSAVSDPLGIATDTLSSATKLPNLFVACWTVIATQPLLSAEHVHRDERHDGEEGEHHRRRVDGRLVEREPAFVDMERERLRGADDPSGDDGDRPVLAERPRRGQHDAVGDAPTDRRQRDAPERGRARRAERPRGLLLVGPYLAQDRDDLADDERKGDEDRRDDHAGQREDDADAVVGEPASQPAVLAVDEDQRQADDDRRQRERKPDRRVQEPVATPGAAAHDGQRAHDPEGRVRRHGDRDDDQGHLESVCECRARQLVPDRGKAVLEHPVEDHPDRDREQQEQVSESREAEPVAPHSACLRVQRSSRSAPTSTANEHASRTTDTAAAAEGASPSISSKMYQEVTSVWNGMFPEIRITAPNSPIARPNPSAVPERIAGIRLGRTIRRNVVEDAAPSEKAASSISRSSSSSTGWTARMTNGSVTKSNASAIATCVNATLTPNGLCGP